MKKLLIIPLLFLFACKPQKSIKEYKYITKTDTLVRTQINTIYQSVNDTTYIENPCDSTGILNQFYAKISIPFGSVKIRAINNKIESVVNVDKIESVHKEEISKSASDSIREVSKEIIKYRIPTWAIALMFIETAIIVLYLWFKLN